MPERISKKSEELKAVSKYRNSLYKKYAYNIFAGKIHMFKDIKELEDIKDELARLAEKAKCCYDLHMKEYEIIDRHLNNLIGNRVDMAIGALPESKAVTPQRDDVNKYGLGVGTIPTFGMRDKAKDLYRTLPDT